jgi:membrane fusion protein (multidrug efflux system)
MANGEHTGEPGEGTGQQPDARGGQQPDPGTRQQPDRQASQQPDGGDGKGEEQRHAQHHRKFLWIFGAAVVVIGIGVLLFHLLYGQYHVKTKDAYVGGNLIRLQPQVSGTVTFIAVDQTQPVRLGQTLVQLDPKDTEVSLSQAKANLAQTVRDVVQLFTEERRQEALSFAQEAQLSLANKELARDRGLIGSHGISQEQLDRTEENARNAQAGIRQARAALESVRAQIAGTQPQTHPRVLLAESNLRSAWLAKNRTIVRAPLSGYMVRREVQLGQQVTPATEIVAIAPLDTVWIDANFKETQLENIRINQPVIIKADIYGSHFKYHGRVLGLTAGTGAALAVLPPENATGNWIKIVQRLPVRIGLDPRELRDHPLYLGLSTTVDVDVHDVSGAPLSRVPVWPAAMKTNVYAEEDAGVSTEIEKIVRENLQGSTFDSPMASTSP